MKKKQITFDKKLSLDKLTVAKLDDEQSISVEGGKTFSITCNKAVAEESDVEASCIACSCN